MGTTAARLALCWALGEAVPALAAPDIAVRPVAPAGLPDPAATAETAYQAGKAALADGDARAALAHFRSALRRDPAYVAALTGAGAALDQLGRSDLARPYFEAALAAQPDAPDLMYNLGLSLSMAGYTERARGLLMRAAARGNDDVKARSTTLLASLDGAMAPARAVQRADAPAEPAATVAVAPAAEPAASIASATTTPAQAAERPAMLAASPAPPAPVEPISTGAASPAAAVPAASETAVAVASLPEHTAGPDAVAAASLMPPDPVAPDALIPALGPPSLLVASAASDAQLNRTETGEWRLDLPTEAPPPATAAVAMVPVQPAPRPAHVADRLLARPVVVPRRPDEPRPVNVPATPPAQVSPLPAPNPQPVAVPVAAPVVAASPPQPAAQLAHAPPAVAAPAGGLDRLAAALSAMMPVGSGPGLAGLPDGLVPLVPIAVGRRRRRPAVA
jgi:Flp pilus assembly protein TadD